MQVIILAAGVGSRLRPLTNKKPKCLVEIEKKSILEVQLEIISQCGLKPPIIIGGYKAEQLNNFGCEVIVNKKFETTNMVESLFCASKYFKNEIIISYGDILYTPQLLDQIINEKSDISVAVDGNWLDYWSARMENFMEDLESLRINDEGYLEEIGQKPVLQESIQGQYMGLIKFQNNGIKQLKSIYHNALSDGTLNGKALENAYMTDLLQGLIEKGLNLKGVVNTLPWLEIDTVEDFENEITRQRFREVRSLMS